MRNLPTIFVSSIGEDIWGIHLVKRSLTDLSSLTKGIASIAKWGSALGRISAHDPISHASRRRQPTAAQIALIVAREAMEFSWATPCSHHPQDSQSHCSVMRIEPATRAGQESTTIDPAIAAERS